MKRADFKRRKQKKKREEREKGEREKKQEKPKEEKEERKKRGNQKEETKKKKRKKRRKKGKKEKEKKARKTNGNKKKKKKKEKKGEKKEKKKKGEKKACAGASARVHALLLHARPLHRAHFVLRRPRKRRTAARPDIRPRQRAKRRGRRPRPDPQRGERRGAQLFLGGRALPAKLPSHANGPTPALLRRVLLRGPRRRARRRPGRRRGRRGQLRLLKKRELEEVIEGEPTYRVTSASCEQNAKPAALDTTIFLCFPVTFVATNLLQARNHPCDQLCYYTLLSHRDISRIPSFGDRTACALCGTSIPRTRAVYYAFALGHQCFLAIAVVAN